MPRFFLPDGSYRIGFRFDQPYPNTPYWKKLGMAGKPHLGVDLIGDQIRGTATLAGVSKYVWGSGAGHQCHFYPDGTRDLIRFLHLAGKPRVGRINPGDWIFITGNTGTQTNAPHCHVDIWDLNKGPLDIYNINGFKNPETYNWRASAPVTPAPGKTPEGTVFDMFFKRGDAPALFAFVGGKWIPVGNIYPKLEKEYPNIQAMIKTIPPG